MAGIAGICDLTGRPVHKSDLEQMLRAAAYRGRDGSNAWHEGPVALGHLMLWTTPESLDERLPLYDCTAHLGITADARIDNREELIAALGLSERAREGLSDGELILAAFARWGDNCLSRLLGDFAFAVWDGRRRRLFCARDHFGVKPFYYSQRQGRFAFASDIKPLLTLPWVSRTVDEEAIAGYLAVALDPAETVYRDVRCLPPGHAAALDRAGMAIRRYWTPDMGHELRLHSSQEYAEAFLELFTEAVRCRLRSAYPVGSTLSGGLDSSSVACVARALLAREGTSRRLHTFSGIFAHFPPADERRYIQAVVAEGGIEGHMLPVDHLGPFREYLDSIAPEEGPCYGMSFYLHRALYREAREHNVRVVLDGHDGDTVVSHGYERLTQLARRGHWVSLYRELKALVPRGRAMVHALKWVGVRAAPPWTRAASRRLRGASDHQRFLSGVPIAPDFARRTAVVERLRAAERAEQHRSPRESHFAALTERLFTLAFEALSKLGGSFAIEPRFPFFDRRLVEFCLALPLDQKLRLGWTRYVLREAMRGILPEVIRQRRGKQDLSPCFEHGMYCTDRHMLCATIERNSERLRPFVDLDQLAEAQRACFSAESSVKKHWRPVWRVATLAAWLSTLDDGP